MKSFMYDRFSEIESSHFYFRGRRDIIMAAIEPYLGLIGDPDIVDFGCGTGHMCRILSHIGPVTGVDCCEQALEYSRRNFYGDLILSDICDYPYISRHNVAICADVLEHLPDDVSGINSVYRSLSSGGICVITVPADPSMWSYHDDNNMHFRRYSLESLARLVSGAGFSVDYISFFNSFLYYPVKLVRRAFSVLGINSDSGLETKIRNGFVNEALYRIFSSESKLVRLRKTMRRGVSLICIASKTPGS